MSSNTNLFRDMYHVKPDIGRLGFSAMHDVGKEAIVKNNGIVYETTAMASTLTAQQQTPSEFDQWRASGVLISPPIVDATPYRVKAHLYAVNCTCWIITGYAPAVITGEDLCTKVTGYPCGVGHVNFDEILLIPGDVDGVQDLPLMFAVGVSDGASGHQISYTLSVQNLSKTAPQFAASMS